MLKSGGNAAFRGLPVIVIAMVLSGIVASKLNTGSLTWESLRLRGLYIGSQTAEEVHLSPSAAAAPPQPPPCASCVASGVTIRGSLSNESDYTRKRYRFTNVLLHDDRTLMVWLPPGVDPPSRPHTFDPVNDYVNATTPALPTLITYRHAKTHYFHNFSVVYERAERQAAAASRCVRWEERPAYLMQIPHATNVWHVLNDGLLGAFRTLREEGLLPLAEVDAAGNLKEYIDDLDEDCPWEMVPDGDGVPYEGTGCRPRRDAVSAERCNPDAHAWCRPGLVAAPGRETYPLLLLANGTDRVDKRWRHMFTPLSKDTMGWTDAVGTCFRELYVGKSNLLNFYVPIDASSDAMALRRRALAAFQRYLHTAEAIRRAKEAAKKAAGDGKKKAKGADDDEDDDDEWPGYAHPELERLRQGVGPEEVAAVGVLRRLRNEALSGQKLESAEAIELHKLLFKEEQAARELARVGMAAAASQKSPPRGPRPTVTFMWRSELKRGALNAADLLEYVLRRYNVTVRLTTFEEPLLEAMDLMNSTDVLIGMHGAGWTNTLFSQAGAAALQLYPYGWWDEEEGEAIRGHSYRNIAAAKSTMLVEWFNPLPEYAFMRRFDFEMELRKGIEHPYSYALHPGPDWPPPTEKRPFAHWINQNTLMAMDRVVVEIDKVVGPIAGPALSGLLL